ncbi:MAG: TrkA family potassium uptake protein [Angelakisella sp.]|nr:TrkA family potassium uptake protein [Angelakisella sp.]
MKVLIVGAGKVGYYLSKTLMEHGHTPVLIETDRDLCRHAADELGIKVICGDGSTIDALESAGAGSDMGFVSVTGSDETNLVACQLAKKVFGIGRTVARVNNPKNLPVMRRLGVDIPISSTDNIARLIEREVDSAAIRQVMSLNRGQATISEIHLPKNYEYDGMRLSEIRLPEECVVISITRSGELIIPRGKTCLYSGDLILVLVSNEEVHNLSKALSLENSIDSKGSHS